MANLRVGLTFDDVLLVPQRSSLRSRAEADTATWLTRRLRLRIPVVSANMDTVTEAPMAAAMARLGGIGIIHRFVPISVQAQIVRQARALLDGNLSGPAKATEGNGRRRSRETRAAGTSSESPGSGASETRGDALGASPDSFPLLIGAAVGAVGDYAERAAELVHAGVDILVIDIAHGHSDLAIEATANVKHAHPSVELIAGNVATARGALDLVEAGADAVKVGVGPGAACSTRLVAGAGVPQLTALMDCVAVCEPMGIPVVADGGIKHSGDIVKALAVGASTVMIGSLLAGTDESPGEIHWREGVRFKAYRGMASVGAARARWERETPGADLDELAAAVVPEGVEATVPYHGSIAAVIHQLVGGLRSGMSYSNARTLTELRANAELIQITALGWREGLPRAQPGHAE
ncbi:MAG: IMP dehydrogenase [Chloroflexi bacterium]|nr:IMP dehydrogenase [Chloroflexota bacterium]